MVNLKRMLVRLGILKRRDPEEYSKTEFIEQNRVHWERFIDINLKKSKLRLLSADVKLCRDDPMEDLISIWTENAAKVTTRFFNGKSLGNVCICCLKKTHLTRAHLLNDRPELLKRAISEAPIIDDGHDCHISSHWVLHRYIDLHREYPIAPLCKKCHQYIDNKVST